jgi:hypothetical protein
VVGITLAAPPDPGHSWGDIECSGCITSADVDFNYAGSDSKGGKATSAATADTAATATSAGSAGTVPWDGITNRPSGLDDGDDYTTCSWSGWAGGGSCVTCSGTGCGCFASVVIFEFYCSGGKVTQARTTDCCIECFCY